LSTNPVPQRRHGRQSSAYRCAYAARASGVPTPKGLQKVPNRLQNTFRLTTLSIATRRNTPPKPGNSHGAPPWPKEGILRPRLSDSGCNDAAAPFCDRSLRTPGRLPIRGVPGKRRTPAPPGGPGDPLTCNLRS
jgi:hypothetical protein